MKQLLLILITGLFCINILAQQPSQPSPQMQAATQLVREQKWTEAANALETITKSEPNNGRAWFLLGSSYHQLGNYEKAAAAYEKNIPISNNPTAMYNLACSYSRLKQADKAFEWLEKSINSGGGFGLNLETDADLAILKNDERFKKMGELIERKTKPCLYQPQPRQFDFWIGEWDVFNPAGQKAGINIVQSFSEGCGLMENWTGTIGGNGKSINYYDASTGKWYQHWIGSGGGAVRYEGNFIDGAMRFEGFTVGQNGQKTLNKLTFFKIDENTVRQLAEVSTDEGKNWTVSYDFKYVRMKKQ
ncbi:MAG: tetratricopeptide repeat protein [Pyrinomonadaceae bacterium]|nr:tetratricopeptide repeat protein [Pyrinomonadaceae bacterium]